MTETGKLIVAIVGTGLAVGGSTFAGIGWVRDDIAEVRADVRSLATEAAADRRAHQSAMDTFRLEMLRLAERQARVEGQLSLVTESPPPGREPQ